MANPRCWLGLLCALHVWPWLSEAKGSSSGGYSGRYTAPSSYSYTSYGYYAPYGYGLYSTYGGSNSGSSSSSAALWIGLGIAGGVLGFLLCVLCCVGARHNRGAKRSLNFAYYQKGWPMWTLLLYGILLVATWLFCALFSGEDPKEEAARELARSAEAALLSIATRTGECEASSLQRLTETNLDVALVSAVVSDLDHITGRLNISDIKADLAQRQTLQQQLWIKTQVFPELSWIYYFDAKNAYMGYQRDPDTAEWLFFADALPTEASAAAASASTTQKVWKVNPADGTPIDPPQRTVDNYIYLDANNAAFNFYFVVSGLQKNSDPYSEDNSRWTEPFIFSNQAPGVSLIHKVTDPLDTSQQWGIFGADFELRTVSVLLQQQRPSGVLYITDRAGYLIAVSDGSDVVLNGARLMANSSSTAAIRSSAIALLPQLSQLPNDTSNTSLAELVTSSSYWMTAKAVYDTRGIDWVLVSVITVTNATNVTTTGDDIASIALVVNSLYMTSTIALVLAFALLLLLFRSRALAGAMVCMLVSLAILLTAVIWTPFIYGAHDAELHRQYTAFHALVVDSGQSLSTQISSAINASLAVLMDAPQASLALSFFSVQQGKLALSDLATDVAQREALRSHLWMVIRAFDEVPWTYFGAPGGVYSG